MHHFTSLYFKVNVVGYRVSEVLRSLTSQQCGLGSIRRCYIICGLNLLVLYSFTRRFSLVTLVFPSPENQCLIQMV